LWEWTDAPVHAPRILGFIREEREYAVRVKRALILAATMLILTCAAGTAQNCAMPNSERQVSTVQPPRSLQSYSALLSINLKGQRHFEQQAWRLVPKKNSPVKLQLSPVRLYVRCMLAGDGDVLRFGCANGFRPANPVQSPPSPDGFVEDTPNYTGTTLQTGALNTITYDCVRITAAPHHKPAVTKK
jgi:hypothetical protein